MTTKEVAEYLHLHPVTIQRYAVEGHLPAIRIGRTWRFNKERIDQWIAGNKPMTAKERIKLYAGRNYPGGD